MRDRKQEYNKVFLAVSILATIFVLAEIILQSFGKSICLTQGCKVVAKNVRYGEISILLIGLVTFSFLAIVSYLDLYRKRIDVGPLINLVLIVSLACEGFFTGYQAFSVHTPCVFCLIILALLVVLGLIRLLAGEKEIITGFVSLAAVFCMLYLVLPAGGPVDLPTNERVILFFSKDCKHCAEVIEHLDEKKIEVKHLEVNGYASFLKSMGIDTVPTIMVNGQNQRLFLSGKNAILNYLCRCSPSGDSCEDIGNSSSSDGTTPTNASSQGTGTAIDIFSHPSLLIGPMSSDEDGMCKQDEVCE
jgi:glutaredoxin